MNNELTTQEATRKLAFELENDRFFFEGYKANIALSFRDEFSKAFHAEMPEDLRIRVEEQIGIISNTAAENFLRLFIGKPIKEPSESADGYSTSFMGAFSAMLQGEKATRDGWNGEGIWVAYNRGKIIFANEFWNPHAKAFAESNGGRAQVGSYYILKSAQGIIEMGWRPTPVDLFANDWRVVK